MLNGLDLFSGIGGITIALQDWVRPVAYCEIDPYPRAVLLSRMSEGQLPIAPIWDDVTTLKGCELPKIDIIYGGFPCQDISIANTNGKGLEGKRSGLFFEIMRLVDEVRPQFIFLENVPAIIVRGLDTVKKEITKRGYDCRWTILSAKEVGAQHLRKRWFILANFRGESLERCLIEKRSNNEKIRSEGSGLNNPANNTDSWQASANRLLRELYGISDGVDRIKCLGNSVYPASARKAFQQLMGL